MEGVGIVRRRQRAVSLAVIATLLAAALGTATPVSADSSPIARWKLDEGSGNSINDDVGTADGSTSGNPTWLTSNVADGSAALRLDGVNDQIAIPATSAIEPAEATITVWVRGDPQHVPAAGEVVLEKGSFACDGPSYGIYVADVGFDFSFRSPTGEQILGSTDGTFGVQLWDGNWHLVALSLWLNTFGPQVVASLGIDGYPYPTEAFTTILPAPQSAAITYAGATHSDLVVGGPVDASCGASHFKGDVDDVRIYTDPQFIYYAGTLMPPIDMTVSGLQPATAHPGEQFTTSVDLSPHPRWGSVVWSYFKDGTWTQCCSDSVDYLNEPDGHVQATGEAPSVAGTFDFKAEYKSAAINIFLPNPPYQDASSETTTLEVVPWPTTTTVTVSPDTRLPYSDITLTAHVASTSISASHYPVGSVKFYDTTPATSVLLGTRTLMPEQNGVSFADLSVTSLGGGSHAIVADFVGPDPARAGSTSDPLDAVVDRKVVNLLIDGPNLPEANFGFQLFGQLNTPWAYFTHDATVTFKKVGDPTPICTVPASLMVCDVPGQPVGTLQYYAEYSGNTDTEPVTTSPVTVQVVADTVHADGVGVQYGTFYPVKDNYRDTDAIRGYRWEPIAVTIKIYKPSGSLLKTISIASGSGVYSYAWTGRTSSGTILPEGKYKVVQTLKDGASNTRTVTSYVTLSKKKLVYSTATLTQLGTSLDARGYFGTGSVTTYSGSHSVRVKAIGDGLSFAGAGWQFSLPSAAVYKSVVGRMYGRRSGGGGVNVLRGQRFDWCAYSTGTWLDQCFQTLVTIPATTGTTNHLYKSGPMGSQFRAGRKVRLTVVTTGGTIYVYKVSIVVTYGVLKY